MTSPDQNERVRKTLKRWQERLLDQTGRNPLLRLNGSRSTKLQVTAPSSGELFSAVAVNQDALHLPYVRNVQRGPESSPAEQERHEAATVDPPSAPLPEQEQWVIEPGDVTFAETSGHDLRRRLKRLYDNSRTSSEERGVTTLQLGVGVLFWDDLNLGRDCQSPLWLIPCRLTNQGPAKPLVLEPADEEVQINPALDLFLRERHKLVLPSSPDDPSLEAFTEITEFIKKEAADRRWRVSDEAWLGTFSFESLALYRDLQALEPAAIENPIVRAFCGLREQTDRRENLPDDLDTLLTPDVVPVPVLPTDSSQLAALVHAARRQHIVIHGPPGTGKSQTIANLIADALGRGLKILFVSAKMAALEVVHHRLVTIGLGDHCLEAHSTKAGKAKIIEELRRILEESPATDDAEFRSSVEELLRLRDRLGAYVRALHSKPGALELSVFKVIGRWEHLQSAPDIQFELPWRNLMEVTAKDVRARTDALDELGAVADLYAHRHQHPWRGFVPPVPDPNWYPALENDLRAAGEAATSLLAAVAPLQKVIGGPSQLTVGRVSNLTQALRIVASVGRLPRGWWSRSPDALSNMAGVLDEAAQKIGDRDSSVAEFSRGLSGLVKEGFDLLAPVCTIYRDWRRFLKPSFYKWRKELQPRLVPGTDTHPRHLRVFFAAAQRALTAEKWLHGHRGLLADALTELSSTKPENVAALANAYRAAAVLHASLTSSRAPAPAGIVAFSEEQRQAAKRVLELVLTETTGLAAMVRRLDAMWPSGAAERIAAADLPLPSLAAWIASLLKAFPRIHEHLRLEEILNKATQAGLAPLLVAIGERSARVARAVFERRFFRAWADAAIMSTPALSTFVGSHHDSLVSKFRDIDTRIRSASLRHIHQVASRPLQQIRRLEIDAGEVAVLRKELQKKKRIKPLRKLFAEIPTALQALKPCMLMSPISVSTYLKPGAVKFDLVVFDEASQIPTPEAVPAVLRSKQVVAAGDSCQLPPTSFFDSAVFDEHDDETTDEVDCLESLLDDCVAAVPVFTESHLRWHYRSLDERLIQFSNWHFYNNRLTTFPSPTPHAADRGVRFEHVSDGVWDRGKSRTNRQEARRVAQLVVDHLRTHPERSLGVVAMNVSQKEAIEDAIDEELAEEASLAALLADTGDEPFFVKSIENVQGDERDVIMISVGYGRDPVGGLAYNFGPLNMEGGWRRLNVLVTRAKWQVVVVASIRAHELPGINPNNRGAVALRNYLEFAERGCLPPPEPTRTAAETNDFEDAVMMALRDRGFIVEPQIGVGPYRIDLAVRYPSEPLRYALGVECDGAAYHSSRSARDRDLLRQQTLEAMGWRLYRVWSTEWFRDRERTLDALVRAASEAVRVPPVDAGRHREATRQPASESPVHSRNPANSAGERPPIDSRSPHAAWRDTGGMPYRRCPAFDLDRQALEQAYLCRQLASAIARVVRVEGPVHEEIVLDRLMEFASVNRAGRNIRANLKRALHEAEAQGVVSAGDGYWCVRGADLPGFRVPSDGVVRSVEYIPPVELRLAALHVVRATLGIQREALLKEVARLFGVERLHAKPADLIRETIDGMVDGGLLRARGPNIVLP